MLQTLREHTDPRPILDAIAGITASVTAPWVESSGEGFRVQGCGVLGFEGFRVLGFGVEGLGFRVFWGGLGCEG